MRKINLRYDGSVLKARVPLPASKSISNRLLILRELSGFDFEIKNLSNAADTGVLQECLQELGNTGHTILNAGDAGTAARFLTALLAFRGLPGLLTGSASLQRRPVCHLVDALRKMGAHIRYAGIPGVLPLEFGQSNLNGGRVTINAGTSSQFISALLMIGPCLTNGLQLELEGPEVSGPYIAMTLALMERLGAKISRTGNVISVEAGGYHNPGALSVEADWSAAAPWFSLAAMAPGSSFFLEGLNLDSIQGDRQLTEIFRRLGVVTTPVAGGLEITSEGSAVSGIDFDFVDCPDLAQSTIVVAAALGIRARFTGLQTLRHKETNRFRALLDQLGRLGIVAGWDDDQYIELPGMAPQLKQLPVQTYNDHRMAMAFAPLVVNTGELIVEEPQVVEKSYPAFWQHLRSAGIEIQYSE